MFQELADEAGLEPEWRPQASVLYEAGLRGGELSKLAEARPEIFQSTPATLTKKLQLLKDIAQLRDEDLVKVVTKFPRILEYQIDRTIRPRLEFLKGCGVADADVAKVVLRAPMVLELGVDETLDPRTTYLTSTLGIGKAELGTLLVRHPQVLTCSQEMMALRVAFLERQGLSKLQMRRTVLAHPQVLHYKIESMQERVNYLLSIGMPRADVAMTIARCPQLLSLKVDSNLAPKWRYLVEHLGGDITTICKYPGYFSLSLQGRIIPRHRFYVQCKEGGRASSSAGEGQGAGASTPFQVGMLKVEDASFAAKVCGSSLEEYQRFKGQGTAGAAGSGAQQPGSTAPGAAPPPPSPRILTGDSPLLRRVGRRSALSAGSGGPAAPAAVTPAPHNTTAVRPRGSGAAAPAAAAHSPPTAPSLASRNASSGAADIIREDRVSISAAPGDEHVAVPSYAPMATSPAAVASLAALDAADGYRDAEADGPPRPPVLRFNSIVSIKSGNAKRKNSTAPALGVGAGNPPPAVLAGPPGAAQQEAVHKNQEDETGDKARAVEGADGDTPGRYRRDRWFVPGRIERILEAVSQHGYRGALRTLRAEDPSTFGDLHWSTLHSWFVKGSLCELKPGVRKRIEAVAAAVAAEGGACPSGAAAAATTAAAVAAERRRQPEAEVPAPPKATIHDPADEVPVVCTGRHLAVGSYHLASGTIDLQHTTNPEMRSRVGASLSISAFERAAGNLRRSPGRTIFLQGAGGRPTRISLSALASAQHPSPRCPCCACCGASRRDSKAPPTGIRGATGKGPRSADAEGGGEVVTAAAAATPEGRGKEGGLAPLSGAPVGPRMARRAKTKGVPPPALTHKHAAPATEQPGKGPARGLGPLLLPDSSQLEREGGSGRAGRRFLAGVP